MATDYCYMFSDAQIESRSLVKLTQAEVDEIKAADGFGLNDIYTANYYVYLIDSDGNPASWHGFYNNLNNGVELLGGVSARRCGGRHHRRLGQQLGRRLAWRLGRLRRLR